MGVPNLLIIQANVASDSLRLGGLDVLFALVIVVVGIIKIYNLIIWVQRIIFDVVVVSFFYFNCTSTMK